MNIQQIKTVGIVDSWVDFTAKVSETKEQKMRGSADKQRMMTKCKLSDSSGETIGAWIEGQVLPGTSYTISGMLSQYNGQKYIDWAKIKYTHPNQEVPQNAPQTPSAPPQATNSNNGMNTSIERQCAWKSACNRAKGTDMDASSIEDLAMIGIHFIETGNKVTNQATSQEDDIPF